MRWMQADHAGEEPEAPVSVRRTPRRALISLTPLIDVVFILLVFFMLASSFHEWRHLRLDPPAAGTLSAASDTSPLIVDLRPDGLRLDGAPITRERLLSTVGERLGRQSDQRIVIRSHAGVVVQDVVSLLDRLKGQGARHISLADGKA